MTRGRHRTRKNRGIRPSTSSSSALEWDEFVTLSLFTRKMNAGDFVRNCCWSLSVQTVTHPGGMTRQCITYGASVGSKRAAPQLMESIE